MIFVTELCNEIVIFWDYWYIAGKGGDKAESSSTESEPMDATTNSAASHPKIQSLFFFFFRALAFTSSIHCLVK